MIPFQMVRSIAQKLKQLSAVNLVRRRAKPCVSAGSAQVLESRLLLAGTLVSDVLSGTTDTLIQGNVYEDLNSNGIKDGGEKGVAGFTLYLDLDGSGTLNSDATGTMEPSAVTNDRGEYSINRLAPGTYRISEVISPGWTPTATISRDVVVNSRKATKSDFFNFAPGEITGYVWNDYDNSGVREDDGAGGFLEPGLAGWTLFLDTNGNFVQDASEPSTLTDANGNYHFTHLPADNYQVTTVLPEGWDPSRQQDFNKTVKVAALQVAVQHFGMQNLTNGAIQGVVWNDLNFDGIRAVDSATGSFTEPGLGGWELYLDLNENDLLDTGEPTATTTGDGTYAFPSVPEGNYHLVEALPAKWNPAPGFTSQQVVSVSAGRLTHAADFGNMTVLDGGIRGTVWNDRFRDGVRDATAAGVFLDPGLVGWQVYVDLNTNHILDAGEPSLLTDAAGYYEFFDLQVGNYQVVEVVPSGWEVTVGYSDVQNVVVRSGVSSIARDFANFDLSTIVPGTVTGSIWSDQNSNGIRDVKADGSFAESGVSGWRVFVDANSNGIFDVGELSGLSNSIGDYTISGITPGTVRLVEQVAVGWRATAPLGGVRSVAVKNAATVTNLDFGNVPPMNSEIHGSVYVDRNRNGLRDPGEPGFAGATVYLDTNSNGSMDVGEPNTATSPDLFFTPDVNEAGSYGFTHLTGGSYTVRVVLPGELSATPVAETVHTLTLGATEIRLNVDTAAQYRYNEIHGTRFDDGNGNHFQDVGEGPIAGATIYLDLDRDNVMDVDEPRTVTDDYGSYSFLTLDPGAYVVRDVLRELEEHTYPLTTSGTLWPTGTSNPAIGIVTPESITASLAQGESLRQTVSLTLPTTGGLTNLVDVFLLFDDTGSFTFNSPIVRGAFPTIISQLQSALPGTDLGFGVGRFEEYANYAFEYATGRPFILNQPIVTSSTTGYMTAIQQALNRTTPGYGGDGPETDIEALYQLVTGVGFDGNNNGTVTDSGSAGLASTQLLPGNSGDVPAFASFQADLANSVLPAAGNVGGGGFRAGALPIILTATDIGFAYQPKGETSVTGVGGVTLPVQALTGTSRPATPFGHGAGLQETVTALNALGALVIGLGTNAQATIDPRRGLEALSTLTGAVNRSTATIANGTSDPIAPGDPLYFQISSGFATSVANGIVNAIQNAATSVAVDLSLKASDPRVRIINHTGTVGSIAAGQTATFDVELVGDGIPHRFDLQIIRAGTNVVLGSIPVVLGTPVPGDAYEFEDLQEGEIHRSVDFGSRSITTVTNHAPSSIQISHSTVVENAPIDSLVGQFSTTDVDSGNTFVYQIIGGDVTAFSIVGDELRTAQVFDFEAKSFYNIKIRSTDQGGLFVDQEFTVTVDNVNDSPVSIALSSNSVFENAAVGELVGTLSTLDADGGGVFTYEISAGDAAFFSLSGNELRTAAGFDLESRSTYSVTVRSTDAGGLAVEQAFEIVVLNVNESPLSITLDNTQISENRPIGEVVGNLSTNDPDSGDLFTYELVGGDTFAFSLLGNTLTSAIVFDFESRPNYSITVRSTDAGGLAVEQSFDIKVFNVNESPLTITLDNTQVPENHPIDEVVGNLSTNDPDSGELFTYELVGGDTFAFSLLGNTLTSAIVFDFESRPNYNVTVRSTDAGGISIEQSIEIAVANINDAPQDIILAGQHVPENRPVGEVVGTITAVDPDIGELFTYELVGGDVSAFQLVGNELRTSVVFDFETRAEYSLTIRATDSSGLSIDKSFVISVTDVGGRPPVITLPITALSYKENAVDVLLNSTATVTDPDSSNYNNGVLSVSWNTAPHVDDRLSIRAQGNASGQINVVGGTVSYSGVVIGFVSGGFVDNSAIQVVLNAKATPTAVAALLKNLRYRNVGDDPGNAPRTVAISLFDGIAETSAVAVRTIQVVPVNDAPIVSLTPGNLTYEENAPRIFLDGSFRVADVDSHDFDLGTLRVSIAVGKVSTDRISIQNQGVGAGEIGITGNAITYGGVTVGTFTGGFTSSSGLVVTFNANATAAVVQAVARQVTFHNVGDNPTDATRSVTFVINDGDGGSSATVTRLVNVTPINDGPQISGLGATVNYSENKAAVVVAASAIVSDPDSANFDGGVLTVTLPIGATAADLLLIRNVGTAAGQIAVVDGTVLFGGIAIGVVSGGTGGTPLTVLFNASSTLAGVQAVVRNITFQVVGPFVGSSTRRIRFGLTDGDGGVALDVEKSVNVIDLG